MNEIVSTINESTPAPVAAAEATTSTEWVLDVQNLSRYFGSLKAVNDISFRAKAGEILGFIGPNGAGKTTTMRILATLDLPTVGEAYVCGHSVIDHPDRVRRTMGYMPDSFGKYFNMNVIDYLDFFARAYGLKGPARHAAVEHVLVFTELRKLKYKPIKSLSKGMSQRLGLGRTLIHDPQLLILDEPAAGLDPRARVELRELVHLLARDLNKTVLISSHILTELGEICDSVAIIEAGRILASGNVDEIQRQKRNLQSDHQFTQLMVRFSTEFDRAELETAQRWLLEQPFVKQCDIGSNRLQFDFTGNENEQADLLKRMVENKFPLVEFHGKTETLEDTFMNITRGITQ